MATRHGIQLDAEHARRVAAGEIGLAALAGELGVARQTLHVAFKRRAWPTTAAAASASAKPSKTKIAAKAPTAPAQRQEPLAASSQPPASNWPPEASAAPAAAIPITTAAELAEFCRQSVANVALLALAQLHEQLGSTRLGPGAIKAGVQAAQGAADLLHRAGIMLDQEGAQEAPRMVFVEMTAAEIESVQQQAEREFRGEACIDDDDDLLESDQSDNQQSISL